MPDADTNPQSAIVASESAALAAAPQSTPTLNVAAVLEAAVKGGVTADNVAVVKELVALQERMEARQAERDFAISFNALQAEMPAIKAMKPVPDRNGNVKFKFAPYEEIMEQVRPFLLKHGFSVAFSMTFSEGRVTQTCKLTHVGGHSKENAFSVRIGSGPPGASEAQADGAAGTYAKRHAFCNAVNIVIEQDTDGNPHDARQIGAPISADKVLYLKELIKETKASMDKFLAVAQVTKLEEIGEADYPRLVAKLEARKQQS